MLLDGSHYSTELFPDTVSPQAKSAAQGICVRDALGKCLGCSRIPHSFSPGKLSRKKVADTGAGKGGQERSQEVRLQGLVLRRNGVCFHRAYQQSLGFNADVLL